jgi:flagellar hook protein FlgE
MSLYGAMFSGVSGLNANSQALGAIADNITNVNTIGYKSTEVRFQTLVTAQASANNYSPGGVQQRPFAAIDVQGLFQSSTNATDLGISGDGFFVVNEASAHDGSTGFNFTRAGAFNADKSGYLKNTAGYYLQGYKTNATGQTVDATNTAFNPDPTVFTNLETIRLNNIGGTADATESLTFGANLNAEDAIGSTSNTTIQVYDSLGVAHNLQMQWTKAANNQWDLSVEPPSGAASAVLTNSTGSVYASVGRLDFTSTPTDGDTISVVFDTTSSGAGTTVTFEFAESSNAATQNGGNFAVAFNSADGASGAVTALVAALNLADVSSGAATLGASTTGGARFVQNSSTNSRIDISQTVVASSAGALDARAFNLTINASGTSVSNQSGAGAFILNDLDLDASSTAGVTFDGSGIPTVYQVDDISLDINNGSADLAVDFNFGTVGQADGLTQFAAAYNPTFIDTDGAAFGQFSGVTISEAGLVTALFENGDIRPIFKIPVATFPNPNGLGSNTGNVYNQTDFSGLFFMRTAGSGGAGSVQNSVLESSTVDIAKEFTTMITTQRAYSASAKIISTADEMLNELVRIKR